MDNIYIQEQVPQVNEEEIRRALKHFNWGAFGFSWIWGLGNGSLGKTWYMIIIDVLLQCFKTNYQILGILLLCSLITRIYFGINGNKWAFDNRAWFSIKDYTETQKRWAIAMIVALCLILVAVLIGICFAFIVMHAMVK